MMIEAQTMMGENGSSMMLFGWIIYLLLIIILVLGISALIKYIQK